MGLSFVTDCSARDRPVDLAVLIIQQHRRHLEKAEQ